MIKNIVFDIGNVLAGFVWEEFFESFGYGKEINERIANATVKSSLWNETDRGELTDEEILAGFIANDPELEKELRRIFENMSAIICCYDHAIPWIKELKERGYGVYYISNFSRKAHAECRAALDFLPEMDGGIFSYQERLIKPAPEIYRLLFTRYHLDPRECVFIDDTQVNVDAAVKEKMAGITFHSLEQAKKELEELLAEE